MQLDVPQTHSNEQESRKKKGASRIWDILYYGTMAFIIFMYLFVVQNVVVSGESMNPTLNDRDFLMVSRSNAHIDQGDIVIVNVDGLPSPWIKRVIGVPGDTIEIEDNRVRRNGTLLEEPYINGPATSVHTPVSVTLEEDMYWLMGDNRDNSSDSRLVGPVHLDNIQSELLLRLMPFKTY